MGKEGGRVRGGEGKEGGKEKWEGEGGGRKEGEGEEIIVMWLIQRYESGSKCVKREEIVMQSRVSQPLTSVSLHITCSWIMIV